MKLAQDAIRNAWRDRGVLPPGETAGTCPQCGDLTIAGVCNTCVTAQRGAMASAEPTHVVFVNRRLQGRPATLEQREWEPGLVTALLTVARERGWLSGPNRHVFFFTNQLAPQYEGQGGWTMQPVPAAAEPEEGSAEEATEATEGEE